jgi:ribonuclease HI
MTLLAAIKGLEAVKNEKQIVLYSPDRYLANAMAHKSNRTANNDLWEKLDEFSENKSVSWRWAAKADRSPGNQIANRVANMEAMIYETNDTKQARQSSPQVNQKSNKFSRRQSSNSQTSRKNGKGKR